jgi:hypothetical protein
LRPTTPWKAMHRIYSINLIFCDVVFEQLPPNVVMSLAS